MLDPLHVLTAQHCLYDDQGRLHSPERCFIIAGAHRRPGAGRRCGGEEERRNWQMVGVETFFMRQDYDKMTHVNDIAVLR